MTAFDDARALIAGEGRFERDTAFEPVLVPLVAGDVAPTEVEFACFVGSLVSRPESWHGWPLFGVAVAHRLAPLVTVETAHRCVEALPDLVFDLEPELIELIADGQTDEPVLLRLAVLRGDRPPSSADQLLHQWWDPLLL